MELIRSSMFCVTFRNVGILLSVWMSGLQMCLPILFLQKSVSTQFWLKIKSSKVGMLAWINTSSLLSWSFNVVGVFLCLASTVLLAYHCIVLTWQLDSVEKIEPVDPLEGRNPGCQILLEFNKSIGKNQ